MRNVLVAVMFGVCTMSQGMPMRPQSIPGDRLIKNLEAALAKHPNDPRVLYLLGRAHYAMFASSYEGGSGEVEIYPGQNGLPSFPYIFGYVRPWDGTTSPKPTASNLAHIRAAVKCLSSSLQRAKDSNGLENLTLACVFESAAPIAEKVGLAAPFAAVKSRASYLAQAAENYLRAFDLAYKVEQSQKEVPIFGLATLISYESARSYLRVSKSGVRRAEIAQALAKFDRLPRSGIVTPLIFDLDTARSLTELLDSSKTVRFDLDGTGLPQRYPWVRGSTAILVWDPEGSGHVASGRRLFGNATWWMLWSSAYEALAALDDDADGWLRGIELKGLAIWRDRNQNGVSESGEVVPIQATAIAAIRTTFSHRIGLSYAQTVGIVLSDGRTLPTYDWVTKAK